MWRCMRASVQPPVKWSMYLHAPCAPCLSSCQQKLYRTTRSKFLPTVQAKADTAVDVEGVGSLKRAVEVLRSRLQEACNVADTAGLRARLALLEDTASSGNLWTEDPQKAQEIMGQMAALRYEIDTIESLQSTFDDAVFASELLEASEDKKEQLEIMSEAQSLLEKLEGRLDQWETRKLLNGLYDDRSACITINAGAGGVDAMDWAEMLERMYTRWAQAMGYSTRTLDRAAGEEAGLKSVELEVTGIFAYGYLKGEKGTHRLVRSSPFNAKGLRQTSFAGVEVMPLLGDMQVNIDIKESDLQMSFQRAGGAGGQNVNKVETGVRITHVPTGLSVKCTQERTQAANRQIAMDMLKAKLLVVLEEQQAQKVAEIRGDAVKAEWGQQIRNYVFHPYKLVKDTRTGYETSDVQGVMDGELTPFISSFLRLKGQQATQQDLGKEP